MPCLVVSLALADWCLTAKLGALTSLNYILEFDITKLLYHYNRFLSYTG